MPSNLAFDFEVENTACLLKYADSITGIAGLNRLWCPFIHKGQMYRQMFLKIFLRRIQILIPSVLITSQLKYPIITRKPLLTPLKFTVFLANLVSIYSTPAKLVKSPNPQFLTALLLYMGQILNPVSSLEELKTQFKIRMLLQLLITVLCMS